MINAALEPKEIDQIFACLFGVSPNEDLKQYYSKVSTYVISTYPDSQKSDVELILKKRTLLISLSEFLLRLRPQKHLLCILFKLMVHTIETRPEYRNLIINTKANHRRSLILSQTMLLGIKTLIILVILFPISLMHRIRKK